MMSVLSKQAILTGIADQLCLVCESYFRELQEAVAHAATAEHREKLARTHYVDKYRTDQIRKIRKCYFCELCNIVLKTSIAVQSHVKDIKHKEKLEKCKIKRKGNVIISGKYVIQEDEWHGLTNNNTCIICDIEFENKEDHRTESKHIINLIQSRVNVDGDNIYREIRKDLLKIFHCLTCNEVITEISAHFEKEKHKKLLQMSVDLRIPKCDTQDLARKASLELLNERHSPDRKIIETTDYKQCEKSTLDKLNKAEVKKSNDNSANGTYEQTLDIIDCIPKFQLESIDINFETNIVVCRKCSLRLELRVEAIENHVVEHSNNVKSCEIKPVLFVNNENNESLDNEMLFESPAFPNEAHEDTENVKKESIKTITEDIEKYLNNEIIANCELNTQAMFEDNENNKTIEIDMCISSHVIPNHDHKDIENIETESTKQTPQEDHESKYNAIQKTAEENGLTYNSNRKKVFCGICNKNVPLSVKSIEEHVKGELHKNKVRSCGTTITNTKNTEVAIKPLAKKCNLERVLLKVFVSTFTIVRNIFDFDVVINETYCINHLSFQFLKAISPGRLRCQVCEVNIPTQDLQRHIQVKKHGKFIDEGPMLIHTDSEFIREFRSGEFHCGYCNIIGSWERMEEHLETSLHKDSKTRAHWHLTQYLPHIQKHIRIQHHFHIGLLKNLFI